MRKILLITGIIMVMAITMVVIINNDNRGIARERETASELIQFEGANYQIIPSDMIEKGSDYADILDGLHMDYDVKEEYIKEKSQYLEEGGCIYLTKNGGKNVIIVKDYNNEYVYGFKL
ncbi:MAG: hypothetical protein E7262_05390 [Lachnospiraceae bacterium]|nr:hypothetical protein [Lachnospiraceae bacterium]